MAFTSDVKFALAAVLFAVVVVAAYALRVALKGRARFDRIERQGGSRLLSKPTMEAGYWGLQPAARLLIRIGVDADQISWTSLALGFAAGACLTVGHFGYATVFAFISGLLDFIDGMVARLTGTASEAGEVLDSAVDRYVEFFFLSGLVVYYRALPALQILALLALLGSFMVSYSTAKAEALKVQPSKGSMRRPERALCLTVGAALSALTIPWLEAEREFPVPIGYPMVVALGLVAVIANVSAIERLWSIAKAVRARAKDAPHPTASETAELAASRRTSGIES
ncbi:MAG TPA: CDP-alcohol phosphatidyltransferase family protein [Verrucomicrobiae bacterium]|jgi:CDP-diacylglycerol---glycerol-3-phosphate 3-phosphatidyltransferase|nr:CDP-alcohol phosphatidyltransferase family protein [Verrucomicrobiae bacterium]